MASTSLPGDLDEFQADLLTNICNPDLTVWSELRTRASLLLARAIADGEEAEANRAWFLDAVCAPRAGMIAVLTAMREKKFKDAWDALEQIEISLIWLQRNPFLSLEEFRITELAVMVARWQSLYPYKIFASPELLILRESCSICGQIASPWSSCNHVAGRVYAGCQCTRKVEDSGNLT